MGGTERVADLLGFYGWWRTRGCGSVVCAALTAGWLFETKLRLGTAYLTSCSKKGKQIVQYPECQCTQGLLFQGGAVGTVCCLMFDHLGDL